jgi:hypothetical protein
MDIFPGLWDRLSALANSGRLLAPREVLRELAKGDDELVPWAREHSVMFQDPDEPQLAAVRNILERFPDFIDPEKENPEADPFVVALAVVRNTAQSGSMLPKTHVVVAEESRRRTPDQRPRIPDVCDAYGISCMRIFDLMRTEGWAFR